MLYTPSLHHREKKEILEISLLGSTGSIGTQTLGLIHNHYSKNIKVKVLTGGCNVDLLIQQAKIFKPDFIALSDPKGQIKLKEALAGETIEIITGENCIIKAAQIESDLTISAISGFDGFLPTLEAAKRGTIIALANKECIVAGGTFFMDFIRQHNSKIIPLDSEHHSVYRCLQTETKDIQRIILTASGGGLRHIPIEGLPFVTPQQALYHPNWSMGGKITVDSASLMNKGLEIIEAYHLFQTYTQNYAALIHPQSIIHALIEHADGSMTNHLSNPDMAVPINYALSLCLGETSGYKVKPLSFPCSLTFEEVDFKRYPCFKIALDVYKSGCSIKSNIMNAANEVAVNLFLKNQIRFTDIPDIIDRCLQKSDFEPAVSTKCILEIDQKTREYAKTYLLETIS